VPGGEITPEKLIVIGQVAKKFGLYTKITGGSASTCSARRCTSCH
jgi:NAD(P)H-nitrite reductase large subunit